MKKIISIVLLAVFVITVTSMPTEASILPYECGGPDYAVWATYICLIYIAANIWTYGDSRTPGDADGTSG